MLDLQEHGLVVSEGNTAGPRGRIGAPGRAGPAAQKLWRLTSAGLDRADQIMVEGVDGGVARGVTRGGTKHAMAVNETVIAIVRGGTLPDAAGGVCGVIVRGGALPGAAGGISAASRRSAPRRTCRSFRAAGRRCAWMRSCAPRPPVCR